MMTLLLPRSILFDRALRRSFVDGTHRAVANSSCWVTTIVSFIHAITVYASELITRTNLLQKSQYSVSRDGVDLCVSYALLSFRIFRDHVQMMTENHRFLMSNFYQKGTEHFT